MATPFETLQSLATELHQWILDVTPVTPEERDALTSDQQAGLAQLNELRDELDNTLLLLVADQLDAPTEKIEKAQRDLDAISGQMTALTKDLATLATVIQVIGSAVSVASGLVSVGIGVL